MASMAGDKAGKFILRVALGAIVLLHGIAKLKGGIDPISGMVTAQGLPAFVAYGVYVGEVLAPLMLFSAIAVMLIGPGKAGINEK